MGRFLQCPSSNSNPPHHSDQLQFNPTNSDSSTNTSLASQPSLPSVPSLTPSPESSAAAHHRCSATLKGHSSNIFSLALAGKHLLSGASAGEIRLWDRGPSLHTSSPANNAAADGQSSVKSIAVLADRIFTAHHDSKIRVWKIDTSPPPPHHKYKLISTLPTISDRCLRLLSPSSYVKVRRHKKSTWVHHNDAVSALALSSDGSLLYSVSWDRTLKVWRTSDYKCLESVQNAHDDAINAVVLSRDDGLAYTGSADKRIRIWEKKDGDKKHTLVSTLEKHKSAVNALALSGDGSVLYSGACDRSIIVWAKNGGGGEAGMAVVGALRGHTKAILCLAVVKDVLCSGSADRTVRVWGRGSGNSYSCLGILYGHTSPVKCLAAGLDSSNHGTKDCGDSYLVYSGSLDAEIKVWQISVPSNQGLIR